MTARNQVRDPRFRAGRRPVVLVDNYTDEIVDTCAWVEVYDPNLHISGYAGCREPEIAVELIERRYPLEDRPEVECYQCYEEAVWMMPDCEVRDDHTYFRKVDGGEPGEIEVYDWPFLPWAEAESAREPGALKFWVIRVVCKV